MSGLAICMLDRAFSLIFIVKQNNSLYGFSMARVKVYSTGTCPICDKTKALLLKWGIAYDEARVDLDQLALREFSRVTNGARNVPQITIDGKWIGGFSELTELHMEDGLDNLMSKGA